MNKIKRIAFIGSREITKDQEELFFNIGKFIVSGGDFISSGNAMGTDFAGISGANSIKPENAIIYNPWPDYNIHQIHPKNHVLKNPKPEWENLVRPFHPIYDKLSRGAKLLMQRNYGILNKADKCIALLNHKKPGGGGTGCGWRIAESLKIPRLDLNNKSFDEIVEFLES